MKWRIRMLVTGRVEADSMADVTDMMKKGMNFVHDLPPGSSLSCELDVRDPRPIRDVRKAEKAAAAGQISQ